MAQAARPNDKPLNQKKRVEVFIGTFLKIKTKCKVLIGDHVIHM